MSATVSKYRKLPGATRSSLGSEHLWQGGDHLLAVESGWGPERYRRFYYREIRAFLIQRTKLRLGRNIGYSLLSAALAIGPLVWLAKFGRGGSSSWDSDMIAGGIAAGISAGLMLACIVALIVNSLRGPGCRLYILMGAKVEKLGVPRREKQARKIIERLTPEIQKFQGASGAPVAGAGVSETPSAPVQSDATGI